MRILAFGILLIGMLAIRQDSTPPIPPVDETHDFITKDTSITFTGVTWTMRITMPRNYDVAGHPDAESRPVMIFMPGAGEVGTDASKARLYGPHYWLYRREDLVIDSTNGWDGGIPMVTGTRYPIWVTLLTSATNVRPNRTLEIVNWMKNRLRPRGGKFGVIGYSMGGWTWGRFINYRICGNEDSAMRYINAWVGLKGQAADSLFAGCTPHNTYTTFGHWAKEYDGAYFGIESTGDGRSMWKVRNAMRDSLPTAKAYFTFENIDGGTHSVVNPEMSPYRTNWQNVTLPYGPDIQWNTTTNPDMRNSIGNYVTGDAVFTWLYKQGDTTMVGSGAPANDLPTASAGSDQVITLPTNEVSLSGSGSDPDGTIVSQEWTQISGPAATIVSPGSYNMQVTGLTEGVYIFRLTVTDNLGGIDTDDVQVTVSAPTPSNPSYQWPSAGLGEYQAYFIDHQGYWYGTGNLTNIGTGNTGTAGIPQRVQVTPFNLKFKMTAGGLHGGAAIDTAGWVHVVGDNDQGQFGDGTLRHPYYYPSRIEVDTFGHAFNNVSYIVAFFKLSPVSSNGWYAIKNDSLWGWGRMLGGMALNGTDNTSNDSFALRPYHIPIPGNRKPWKISAGNLALVLCTDSTVWTGGNMNPANLGYDTTGVGYKNLRQLTGLPPCIDIAGAGGFNYAIDANGDPWGWGSSSNYMGDLTYPTGNGVAYPTPRLLTNIKAALPYPIKEIVTNYAATHVILTNGDCYGWGDAAQGTVGNGQSIDWDTYPTPYAWNPSDRIFVKTPVHIAPGLKFKRAYGGNVYNYYTYLQTVNDQWLCFGRAKAAVLATGTNMPDGTFQQYKQNSLDRKWPTPVDPFNVPAVYISTSPDCITSPSSTICNGYTIPANTAPVASAGSNQTITTNSVTLSATGSTDNVFIAYYLWTQISGPNTGVIDLPASPTPTVRGLVPGVYNFRVEVTDNGWMKSTADVQITYTGDLSKPRITVPRHRKIRFNSP